MPVTSQTVKALATLERELIGCNLILESIPTAILDSVTREAIFAAHDRIEKALRTFQREVSVDDLEPEFRPSRFLPGHWVKVDSKE